MTYAVPTYQTCPPEMSMEELYHTAEPINVLLVEDDPDAAELVKLSLLGSINDPFHVEWSQNLLESMKRLSEPGIDVVLLDLGLPELNGYKSYRVIEFAAGGSVPVVILTSDDRAITRELTLGFGAAGYFIKGEDSADSLRQALRDAVQCYRPGYDFEGE